MTAVDQVVVSVQEVAERVVRRAERQAKKLGLGDRFEVVDSSGLSRSTEMSTVLRCATLNLARIVKHHSSNAGTHHFEKIR